MDPIIWAVIFLGGYFAGLYHSRRYRMDVKARVRLKYEMYAMWIALAGLKNRVVSNQNAKKTKAGHARNPVICYQEKPDN